MSVTHLTRALAFGLLLGLAAPNPGCSRATQSDSQSPTKELSGVYVDEPGVLRFHFQDGRVRMTGGIADFETVYEVEGDQLWITTSDGQKKAMTIRKDGALTGELGVFVKKL